MSWLCEQAARSFGNKVYCRNAGVLFEDGKWWCKTHAPSMIRRRDLCEAACEGVPDEVLVPGLLAAALKSVAGVPTPE